MTSKIFRPLTVAAVLAVVAGQVSVARADGLSLFKPSTSVNPSQIKNLDGFMSSAKVLLDASKVARDRADAIKAATEADIANVYKGFKIKLSAKEFSALIPWQLNGCQVYQNSYDASSDTLSLELKNLYMNDYPYDRRKIRFTSKTEYTAEIRPEIQGAVLVKAEHHFSAKNPFGEKVNTSEVLAFTILPNRTGLSLVYDSRNNYVNELGGMGQLDCGLSSDLYMLVRLPM